MRKWNAGLVNAFPVPEDRQHGKRYPRKKQPPESLDKQLDKLNLNGNSAEPEVFPDDPLEYNRDPFPFFSLPAELRNRVYNFVLFTKPPYRRANGRKPASQLSILLASKRFHTESSYTLYTTHKFLIFPVQVFNPLPTIQELPLHYRALVTNLEMVVGSSWTAPPKSWRVSKPLERCLKNLSNINTLNIFIEFDPSHPAFKKYRISYEFYTDFCGELVEDVLEAMPQLEFVQIDGNTGVEVHGPLVSRLRHEALTQGKLVRYGKEGDWARKVLEEPARGAVTDREVWNVVEVAGLA